jgi:hypothetical protein
VFESFALEHVDLGEVTLRVRHGGRGEPVVLLHGHPRTHTTWHRVAPRLADSFFVVCPDLRGYGRQSRPSIDRGTMPVVESAAARRGRRRRAGRRGGSSSPGSHNRRLHGKESNVSAALKLVREGAGIELRRGPFEIQLDGRTVGSITRHQTVEMPLAPGDHTLRIRKGRYSSHEHSFGVADGEVINFRTHGAMVWPRYVVSIIKPDLAISFKHE